MIEEGATVGFVEAGRSCKLILATGAGAVERPENGIGATGVGMTAHGSKQTADAICQREQTLDAIGSECTATNCLVCGFIKVAEALLDTTGARYSTSATDLNPFMPPMATNIPLHSVSVW